MRRSIQSLFYILMITAATLAGFMAADQNFIPITRADVSNLSSGASLAIGGVVAGLILAWLLRVNWGAIPLHVRGWFDIQRRRFWWFFTAAVSMSILIFY